MSRSPRGLRLHSRNGTMGMIVVVWILVLLLIGCVAGELVDAGSVREDPPD